MNSINEAFRLELRRAIKHQKLTIGAAAELLGVTRQAFHAYLNGTSMPRAKRLATAVHLLKLNLKIGAESFGSEAFPMPSVEAEKESHSQLQLWDALDKISPDNLKLDVKRVGNTLRVGVRIEIPA